MFGRYRAHLETELLRQEQLYKFVVQEKERTIQRLEEELKLARAKCERLEFLLLPKPVVRVGEKPNFKAPAVDGGEGSWASFVKKHMEEEEKLMQAAKEQADGVHGQGGERLHEQTGGGTKRPNGSGGTSETGAGQSAN